MPSIGADPVRVLAVLCDYCLCHARLLHLADKAFVIFAPKVFVCVYPENDLLSVVYPFLYEFCQVLVKHLPRIDRRIVPVCDEVRVLLAPNRPGFVLIDDWTIRCDYAN